jgi:hypothetical protein
VGCGLRKKNPAKRVRRRGGGGGGKVGGTNREGWGGGRGIRRLQRKEKWGLDPGSQHVARLQPCLIPAAYLLALRQVDQFVGPEDEPPPSPGLEDVASPASLRPFKQVATQLHGPGNNDQDKQ